MRVLLLAAAIPTLFVAASGPSFAEDLGKNIAQEVADKWAKEFNSGNAKGVADLYTKDAFFSSSTAGTLMGQDAIEKNFDSNIKQGWKITINLKDARMVKPDVLTAVGEYTFN